MKTMMRILICSLALLLAGFTADAQYSSKQLRKELKSKVEKDCRKAAKALKKEGWKVMPGKLPLGRQIQDSYYAELDRDDKGEKLYFTATHKAIGGNYSAAKKIANERARMELAESINATLSELIKGKVASTDFGDKDIETIDEFVAANKTLVSVSLQGVFPVLEIYREQDNKVEVQVMVKINAPETLKLAQKAYRDKLYQQSEELAKKLDELLSY